MKKGFLTAICLFVFCGYVFASSYEKVDKNTFKEIIPQNNLEIKYNFSDLSNLEARAISEIKLHNTEAMKWKSELDRVRALKLKATELGIEEYKGLDVTVPIE